MLTIDKIKLTETWTFQVQLKTWYHSATGICNHQNLEPDYRVQWPTVEKKMDERRFATKEAPSDPGPRGPWTLMVADSCWGLLLGFIRPRCFRHLLSLSSFSLLSLFKYLFKCLELCFFGQTFSVFCDRRNLILSRYSDYSLLAGFCSREI